MPGPAHTGWTHKRTTGDPDEVARWVPVARKVLGFAIQQAQFNGLLTYKVERRLENGVLLIGELVGGLPRYTIHVPEGVPPPPPPQLVDDFVPWARDADNLGGIDPEYPQQILRKRDDGGWQTYFYDSDIAGYDEFTRRKGTYFEMFPEGVRYGGNIDWESKRGEVISWYGPSSRYWPDAFVQPQAQFGKFVFMLGAVLLDTDQYATDSTEQAHGADRFITGAAIRRDDAGTWLYTVQSSAEIEPSPTPPIYVADFGTWGCPYARQDSAGGIYRYQLTREQDEAGVWRYVVSPNSREQLADLADNHCEPWFFNQSCTVAHCYVLPEDGWYRHVRWWGTDDDPGWPYHEPVATQVFREATFSDAGDATVTDTNLSVTPSGPAVRVATDYRGDTAVHATVANFTSTEYPELGGQNGSVQWDVAGFQFRSGGGEREFNAMAAVPPNPDGWLTAHIVFADLRTQFLVLVTHYGTTLPGEKRYEVYRAGVRVHDEPAQAGTNPVWPMLGFPMGIADWAGMPGPPTADTWRALPPYYFMYGTMLFLGYPYVPAMENPPEDWEIETYPCGLNTGFMWQPYPSWAYFGVTSWAGQQWDQPLTVVSTRAPNGFQGNAGDFQGHGSVFACASKDETAVMSGWRPESSSAVDPSAWAGNSSFHYVTGDELGSLTGIAGAYARYHPIFRLGHPILQQ